ATLSIFNSRRPWSERLRALSANDDDQVFARIFQQLDVGNRIIRQPHRSRSSQAKPRWDQPLA
ncbi:MAG: hypothetical protein WBE50_09245, partial [Methyloceanibacter sp.]